MKRLFVLLFVLTVILILGVAPALAGTASVTGTLTSSDPIYPNGRPEDSDCGDQIDDLLPEKYRYQLYSLVVSADGDYDYIDDRGVSNPTFIDIEVAVIDGAFDPENPTVNCLASLDDSETITLQAGVAYTLAVTSYDVPTTGDWGFTIDGPGDVTISALGAGACTNPLPTNAAQRVLPSGAPAFFAPNLNSQTNFTIPAGTWYIGETSGDFAKLWIACGANSVWVPTNAIAP